MFRVSPNWKSLSLLPTLTACACVFGCTHKGERLFPLEVGNRWTYNVRAGFINRVDTLRAESEISVGGNRGFLLVGPMGASKVAWIDRAFCAEELPGTRFSPPLPLLLADAGSKPVAWRGIVWTPKGAENGSAQITHEEDKFEISGKKHEATVATISLHTDSEKIELRTWYVANIGPVRQEQRRSGRLYPAAIYLSGP